MEQIKKEILEEQRQLPGTTDTMRLALGGQLGQLDARVPGFGAYDHIFKCAGGFLGESERGLGVHCTWCLSGGC